MHDLLTVGDGSGGLLGLDPGGGVVDLQEEGAGAAAALVAQAHSQNLFFFYREKKFG